MFVRERLDAVVHHTIFVGPDCESHELCLCGELPVSAAALLVAEDVLERDRLTLVGEGVPADRNRRLVEEPVECAALGLCSRGECGYKRDKVLQAELEVPHSDILRDTGGGLEHVAAFE